MIGEQAPEEVWRGSFAAGQAAAETLVADVGRWSVGQEGRGGARAARRPIGSFADGQAAAHLDAASRGRYSTGQEHGAGDRGARPRRVTGITHRP